MKRREFITLVGGAAVAWPVGAWTLGLEVPPKLLLTADEVIE